ncbi:MAG: phenylalanine--tRNA ligase subunit alpha, partial [Candidatus Thermoplasmatota archaeon]
KDDIGVFEEEKILKELKKKELKEENIDKALLRNLKRRKDVVRVKSVVKRLISLTDVGKKLVSEELEKSALGQLTPELIQSGKWKEGLREYDISAYAPSLLYGKKHIISQMIGKVRRIFLDMGFKEIEGEYIVPCFWNMDALFIPQDHPARDLQDTFFVEGKCMLEKSIVRKIKNVHEKGKGAKSEGWGYKWNIIDAEKLILRTHTTVATISYLSKNPDKPTKVFSIGKVFRREAIDSTHLPEFYQIEGIIMEKNASLRMLIGTLKEFYKRVGFEEIRIRPGYFPYTEPSLEIEVYYKGKYIELGGAGIFRPEVTFPLSIKYPVLAWGLALERLIIIKLGLSDIRVLYANDLDWLKNIPML